MEYDMEPEERKLYFNARGKTIVTACPGSGKTTTLLAKLAILATRMPLEEGKGVCVTQVDVRTASSSYCLPNRKRLVAFPALH